MAEPVVFEVGEIVDLTLTGVRITGFHPGGEGEPATVFALDQLGHTLAFPVDNGCKVYVTRVRPAAGDPQPGEVWQDGRGHVIQIVRLKPPFGGGARVAAIDTTTGVEYAVDQLNREYGPLSPVYRPGVGQEPQAAQVEEAPEPSLTVRQRTAFAAFAVLLGLGLPEVWDPSFRTTGGPAIDALLRSQPDEVRRDMHRWASVLSNPQWSLKPRDDEAKDRLSVTGEFRGAQVDVWVFVPTGLDLAELSAPLSDDAADETHGRADDVQVCIRCGFPDEEFLVPGIGVCRACDQDLEQEYNASLECSDADPQPSECPTSGDVVAENGDGETSAEGEVSDG